MNLKRYAALLILLQIAVPLQAVQADDPGWDELDNWVQSEKGAAAAPQAASAAPASVTQHAGAETLVPAAAPSPSVSPSEVSQAPVFENTPPALVKPALIQNIAKPSAPAQSPVSSQTTAQVSSSGTAEVSDLPSSQTITGYSFVQPAPGTEKEKPLVRKRSKEPAVPEPPRPKNIFAEQFYMNPDQKLRHQTTELDGFVFVETPGKGGKPEYALVTAFGGNVIRTQKIGSFEDLQGARKWLSANLETQTFEGVEVRKLKFPGAEGAPPKEVFWVGNKSYPTPDKAFSEIAMAKTAVEAQGGNFAAMVQEAQTVPLLPEEKPPVQLTPAEFEKQERMVLKMLDSLDIGNELFGPFQGEPSGEPIIWQSFGETTWRLTNLDSPHYDSQVGFWTNRILFKGIRAPLSTIDPFVESTIAMESNGTDFKDNMKLWAGLEWRPFSQNPWFLNFRPWGLPLLEWVRNYRFYVMYGERINLKDEIEGGSADTDMNWGVQIFYEWGIDLPSAGEGEPSEVADYLREYLWGEYFGNYRWEKTNFGTQDDFDAFIWNSSVILGFRLPGIPLPPNPINDELVLMPYMHFEHVNNTRFSFPFQNQYFVGAGVRWMPFRTYRYKENEWLSKVKVFGEYVGVGDVQHAKQDGEAPNAVRYDWRVGVSMSSRRF